MSTQMPPGQRALGMWQAMFGYYAEGRNPPAGPMRGIVKRQDAVEALLHAAMVIDMALQGEPVDPGQLMHVMHMLMAARDFVQPLPSPAGAEDSLRHDLKSATVAIRAGRRDAGVPTVR